MQRLPGGLWLDGRLERDAALREPDGQTEVVLCEQGAADTPVSARVTRVLTHALAHVAGRAPDPALVAALSVPDRQYLMRALGVLLGLDDVWFSPACHACGSRFDFRVRLSALPIKPAGEGYPFALAETSRGRCRVRAPSGADQEAVAGISDDATATRALVSRCVEGVEPVGSARPRGTHAPRRPGPGPQFTDADLRGIEDALERVMPELATSAQAHCPQCAAANTVDLDPYLCIHGGPSGIFHEVHRLASRYHWSQQEILALPRRRRKLYLQLIDREDGLRN